MNALLPDDVAVKKSFYVSEEFSARFDIKGKRYIYRIYSSPTRSPLLDRNSYYCPIKPDIAKMKAAAEFFAGEHDFAAFCAAGGSQKTTVRRLFGVKVEASGEDPCRIEIEVSGEAFLYNMVRIIAGTLMDVGRGKIEPEQIKDIIEAKDRTKAGPTAPPEGLTLLNIDWER
jgi:tRNA pseudouridine38-40 synthase